MTDNPASVLRVLILEDVPTDAELMQHELRKAGLAFTAERVETRGDFARALKERTPDIILADYSLPGFDGLSALALAREQCPDVPFLFVTGTLGEEHAVESLKHGAADYILKGRLSRLGPAVQRALEDARLQQERQAARAEIADELRNTSAMLALGEQMVRGGDPQAVLDKVVETAIAIMHADMGSIQTFDPPSGHLVIRAHRGFSETWLKYSRQASGNGACGAVVQKGERVIVEDVTQSPIFMGTSALDVQLAEGVHAVVSTPLRAQGGLMVGVISAHFKQPHRPDTHALQRIDLLARLTADFIGHVLTETNLRNQLDELRRFEKVAIDRELRIQELKHENQNLLARLAELEQKPSEKGP